MNCTKLNKCLAELDTLVKVQLCSDDNRLILVFGSPDGGMYEDVKLVLTFDTPSGFHLPRYFNGPLKAEIVDKHLAEKIVPKQIYDEYESVIVFQTKNSHIPFYVQFSTLHWKLEGEGPIKTDEELIGEHEMKIPDIDSNSMNSLELFSDILLDSLKKAFNQSNLDHAIEKEKESNPDKIQGGPFR